MKQKSGLKKIWCLFAVFASLFILNFFIKTDIGATQMMWLVLAFCVTVLSIIMLAKNKLPNKKQMLISLLFGILMFVAYQGVGFSSIEAFIVTTLCSMAFFSIFNKYEDNSIKLLKDKSVKSALISILIGIAVGVVWGIFNLLLSNGELNLNITLSCFSTALSPAIYEEISYRAFIFAVCLYFLKGEIATKKEKLTCWFMMIIPHVMIHTPEMFITDGIASGIVGIFLLSLLFGLPFAFLQRKRDLTSAMIAHGVVMIIRFCFLGAPI